jgi:peroxiredoxin
VDAKLRRRMLLALVGVGAAALGAALAWRRLAPAEGVSTEPLFAARFADADGTMQPLAQWRGRWLVVNFWATWCPPCVSEMPDLQAVRSAFLARGVEVIGIGIDNADNVRDFRGKLGLTLPLLVAGVGGSDLNRALGNRAGVLPFTALVSPAGRVERSHLGQLSRQELTSWLEAALA